MLPAPPLRPALSQSKPSLQVEAPSTEAADPDITGGNKTGVTSDAHPPAEAVGSACPGEIVAAGAGSVWTTRISVSNAAGPAEDVVRCSLSTGTQLRFNDGSRPQTPTMLSPALLFAPSPVQVLASLRPSQQATTVTLPPYATPECLPPVPGGSLPTPPLPPQSPADAPA